MYEEYECMRIHRSIPAITMTDNWRAQWLYPDSWRFTGLGYLYLVVHIIISMEKFKQPTQQQMNGSNCPIPSIDAWVVHGHSGDRGSDSCTVKIIVSILMTPLAKWWTQSFPASRILSRTSAAGCKSIDQGRCRCSWLPRGPILMIVCCIYQDWLHKLG
jgi:hypothetical protein